MINLSDDSMALAASVMAAKVINSLSDTSVAVTDSLVETSIVNSLSEDSAEFAASVIAARVVSNLSDDSVEFAVSAMEARVVSNELKLSAAVAASVLDDENILPALLTTSDAVAASDMLTSWVVPPAGCKLITYIRHSVLKTRAHNIVVVALPASVELP